MTQSRDCVTRDPWLGSDYTCAMEEERKYLNAASRNALQKPNSSSAEHFSMRHSGIFLPPSHKCNPIQATSGGVTQSRL